MQVTVSRVDPKIAEGWKLFSEKKREKPCKFVNML